MSAIAFSAPIDVAKADFAERSGQEHFRRIKSQFSGQVGPRGRLIAINVLDGEYVIADSDVELIDKFRARFGNDAIGWVADFAD